MMPHLFKNCNLVFVTVGTTSFDDLIETVLQPETLNILESKGYRKLLLQVGRGKEPKIPAHSSIEIEWYTLKDSILHDITSASLIISHAGAGSCIEALGSENSLVVVINNNLMSNHQVELAGKLSDNGYAAMCYPGTLANTIYMLDPLALKRFPPANTQIFHSYLERVVGF